MSWSINLNTVIMLNTWEIWADFIYIFLLKCLVSFVYTAFSIHKCAFWVCILFCFDFIFFSLVFMNVKTKLSMVTCLEESFFSLSIHEAFVRNWLAVSMWIFSLGFCPRPLIYMTVLCCPTVFWLQYKQVWCVTIIVVKYILYNLYG